MSGGKRVFERRNSDADGKWTKASDERAAAGIAVSQRWSSNETHSGVGAVADGAPAVPEERSDSRWR